MIYKSVHFLRGVRNLLAGGYVSSLLLHLHVASVGKAALPAPGAAGMFTSPPNNSPPWVGSCTPTGMTAPGLKDGPCSRSLGVAWYTSGLPVLPGTDGDAKGPAWFGLFPW